MTATELRLASALGLGIAVIVFVNGGSTVSSSSSRPDGMPVPPPESSTPTWSLAESMDCDGVRVNSPADLGKALVGLDTLSRPLVIEAHIDPAQYESQS